MKRRVLSVVAVLGLVIAASGCSIREVQLWFQFNRHESISTQQAKALADLINSKKPQGGCDDRYTPLYGNPCVPANQTSVHCAGTQGDGPAVLGPIGVSGFDPYGLDPDGDHWACADPVGSIDLIGQTLDHIEVAGWAFDPNVSTPISVDVYDGTTGQRFTASTPRPDLAGSIRSNGGVDHGFDVSIPVPDTATGPQHVCAYAINVAQGGNVLLGCKDITMQDVGADTDAGHDIFGMIEGADRVPGGIHIRGFIVDDTQPGHVPSSGYSAGAVGVSALSLDPKVTVIRNDVSDAFDEPGDLAYGFDFVQPNVGDFATTKSVCLTDGAGVPDGLLMCRPLDT